MHLLFIRDKILVTMAWDWREIFFLITCISITDISVEVLINIGVKFELLYVLRDQSIAINISPIVQFRSKFGSIFNDVSLVSKHHYTEYWKQVDRGWLIVHAFWRPIYTVKCVVKIDYIIGLKDLARQLGIAYTQDSHMFFFK